MPAMLRFPLECSTVNKTEKKVGSCCSNSSDMSSSQPQSGNWYHGSVGSLDPSGSTGHTSHSGRLRESARTTTSMIAVTLPQGFEFGGLSGYS